MYDEFNYIFIVKYKYELWFYVMSYLKYLFINKKRLVLIY